MKGITYDAGAAVYDRFTGRWSIAFEPSLLAAAGVTVGQKVLDVAAGTGALAELAADLVRRKMDLIVTRGSLFTGAAKATTSSMPIVFIAHADPVGTGHVASLARPGGNITRLAILQTELGSKGLELLRSVVPAVTRIAVLWHSGTPSAVPGLKALEEPARMLRLELQPVGARSAAELEGASAAMARARAPAVLVFATPIFFGERHRLGELAIAHRLPTMFQLRDYAQAGGLMSYGADLPDVYRRAAIYVDKILKGAKPADLPSSSPPSSRCRRRGVRPTPFLSWRWISKVTRSRWGLSGTSPDRAATSPAYFWMCPS